METELVLPILLVLGSLWGQGQPPWEGQLSVSFVLLGMQQAREDSGSQLMPRTAELILKLGWPMGGS